MTNQSTVDKLLEMRLTSMSDAFITQLDDPRMKEIPFEDRFGMLVDAEYTNRKNNGLKRLIRGANFDQPEAHVADINYTSGRKHGRVLSRPDYLHCKQEESGLQVQEYPNLFHKRPADRRKENRQRQNHNCPIQYPAAQ